MTGIPPQPAVLVLARNKQRAIQRQWKEQSQSATGETHADLISSRRDPPPPLRRCKSIDVSRRLHSLTVGLEFAGLPARLRFETARLRVSRDALLQRHRSLEWCPACFQRAFADSQSARMSWAPACVGTRPQCCPGLNCGESTDVKNSTARAAVLAWMASRSTPSPSVHKSVSFFRPASVHVSRNV